MNTLYKILYLYKSKASLIIFIIFLKTKIKNFFFKNKIKNKKKEHKIFLKKKKNYN